MTRQAQAMTLQAFQEQAFARHLLVDLPFPITGALLLVVVCVGLLLGKAAVWLIALWTVWTLATVGVRVWIEARMRRRLHEHGVHKTILHQYAWLSVPTGAVSGVFACLYFDAQDPVTMMVLATYMTVIVVGAVVPTSVYLPTFFLFVLSTHLPYLFLLIRAGSEEHFMLVGLNVLFLVVTSQYAYAANRMHRESIRLRFENQQLIADLGERKAAAESASKTKSLFLAGVSHDLKQPIRAIGLYLGVLRHTEPPDKANVLESVTPKMEKALSELHGQVSRLLELSRLESGALRLHIEQVSLAGLFAGLLALFEHQAAAKGIRLRFANLDSLRCKSVWVDRRMLESILQNLISNAIKHTGAGVVYVGVRRRTLYREGGQLCIEVRDSGCGIPLAQQAYLFDAYRSFDDRKASDSHGLGLAIAKAQATYLGADIMLRSAPGRGSVFTLCGVSTRNQNVPVDFP
jgi:signal transduction histidine kinase